jgi:hypothetical protein
MTSCCCCCLCFVVSGSTCVTERLLLPCETLASLTPPPPYKTAAHSYTGPNMGCAIAPSQASYCCGLPGSNKRQVLVQSDALSNALSNALSQQ